MKFQIKHRWNDSVLYECEVPDGIASGMAARHALEKAVAADAYLAGANLTDAYLAGANLADAYLAGANLAGANLTGANLAGANLADANLTGANLAGANLAGANLADANLAGANLADAKWSGLVINKAPIQLFGLKWRVTILDAHMQIGCELHSLAEWAEFDDARIAEMDGRDALRFWRSYKGVLLAVATAAGRVAETEIAA